MNYTYEEKYKWLLSNLEIREVDLWERDALICLVEGLYFQFPRHYQPRGTPNMDTAIELSMSQERKKK